MSTEIYRDGNYSVKATTFTCHELSNLNSTLLDIDDRAKRFALCQLLTHLFKSQLTHIVLINEGGNIAYCVNAFKPFEVQVGQSTIQIPKEIKYSVSTKGQITFLTVGVYKAPYEMINNTPSTLKTVEACRNHFKVGYTSGESTNMVLENS